VHCLGEKSLNAVRHPLPAGGLALVFGAGGGIGSALHASLRAQSRHASVMAFSRSGSPSFDLGDETSIIAAADAVAAHAREIRLVLVATGALAREGCVAEKSLKQIDPAALARAFAINTIGPALLMKHFIPLLPREGRSVFAVLSARVGSIGDNRLGGWYGYRAAKAALNQIVRTAAVELKRSRPEALCVALHPGTVDTRLSTGFAKQGLTLQTPEAAAEKILGVIDGLRPQDSGGFFDQSGGIIPW
jgi:NAD(P)-dependent dehydrogenase (short-subunit alcohol dehydrogenase family)